MTMPLQGIKVLDFTRVLAGPYCTMMLADLGAEVIKIEATGKGDDSRHYGPPYIKGESIYFLSINRGKQSVVIDLKSDRGREIVLGLAEKCDVVVENFRPGSMQRLGLGWPVLKKVNPRLVYASLSGFGQTGPDSGKPGYDLILQALGGFMSITSSVENGPFTRSGVSEADIVAGMTGAFAIVTGLYRREKTGKGDYIDISMLDCQFAFLTPMIATYLNKSIVARPMGNRHALIAPFAVFKTADHDVVITGGNDKLFARICEVLNLDRFVQDPRFVHNSGRITNHEELHRLLETQTRKWKADKLLAALQHRGVPASRINTVRETCREPQILARNMIQTVDHPVTGPVKLHGIAPKFASGDDRLKKPAPRLGEHTARVLKRELGMKAAEITDLVGEKVIALEREKWRRGKK